MDISRGEKVCIIGPNGGGKSTLLKILAGLLYPQDGVFKAFGEEINEKLFLNDRFSKSYHRKVGFIFQDSDVQLFCSTVKEEIAFGPLQFSMSRDDVMQRVDDVLDLLDIQHLKDKPPFRLSGGEKKKVAIASVLVLNPSVLILDEPTNGLDPKSQRWFVNMLLALNDNGTTLIISTHNLPLVELLSDRTIVIGQNHRVMEDSTTSRVLGDVSLLKKANLVDEYYNESSPIKGTRYLTHD